MTTYRVAQHGTLTHQQLPRSMQHQCSLLFPRFNRNKAHRWPADRLADRCRIVRIILAAFEIGLYIARWHQLHRMTESLQLAAPMMSGRTSFDTNKARRQIREKLQHLRTANALAYHYRSGVIDTVNLEYRLRNIETNRDNLAHGRLPSKWFVSTQPPYGTPMPQSGRRPQHHSRPGRASGESAHFCYAAESGNKCPVFVTITCRPRERGDPYRVISQ